MESTKIKAWWRYYLNLYLSASYTETKVSHKQGFIIKLNKMVYRPKVYML